MASSPQCFVTTILLAVSLFPSKSPRSAFCCRLPAPLFFRPPLCFTKTTSCILCWRALISLSLFLCLCHNCFSFTLPLRAWSARSMTCYPALDVATGIVIVTPPSNVAGATSSTTKRKEGTSQQLPQPDKTYLLV